MCHASHGCPQPGKMQQEPPSFTMKEMDSFMTRETVRNQEFGVVWQNPLDLLTFPKGSHSVSSQLSRGSVVSTPPACASTACFPAHSFPSTLQGSHFHAAGELQAAEPRGSSSTWLPSRAQPGDTFAAPACTQALPGACLRVFPHGKGHVGHFSYDLTPARAVSHRKHGPSGAEPELAQLMERPPRPLGPV